MCRKMTQDSIIAIIYKYYYKGYNEIELFNLY